MSAAAPNLLIRRYQDGFRPGSDQSARSAERCASVRVHPAQGNIVRRGGSQRGSRTASADPSLVRSEYLLANRRIYLGL